MLVCISTAYEAQLDLHKKGWVNKTKVQSMHHKDSISNLQIKKITTMVAQHSSTPCAASQCTSATRIFSNTHTTGGVVDIVYFFWKYVCRDIVEDTGPATVIHQGAIHILI
jgi:hypothetical protein